MVLDASLLNTQHYKVRIKGKVEQSREGVAPSPTHWCSSYRKGSLRVTLDYGHQLYFFYFGCKVLCIVIIFLFLSFFSFISKMILSILQGRVPTYLFLLMRFLLQNLVSRSFLVLLRFFFLSLLFDGVYFQFSLLLSTSLSDDFFIWYFY